MKLRKLLIALLAAALLCTAVALPDTRICLTRIGQTSRSHICKVRSRVTLMERSARTTPSRARNF